MKACITLLLFLFSLSVAAQRGGVKFKIKDEQNFNLPGASVVLLLSNHSGTTNQAGTGSEVRPVALYPKDGKFAAAQAGFVTFSILPHNLLHFIDHAGKFLYTAEIKK